MDEARKYLPPILFALLVALFPHALRLPMWVVAWCLFMWAYLLLAMAYDRPFPGRRTRNLLAVIALVGLLVTYHTRIDPDAYVSLLALMAAIKPFEASTHRDRMVTLFLAYFIVITSLFLSETLALIIYMFLSVLVTTAAMVHINDGNGSLKSHFRVSGGILARAVPVMLVLFFLFPRIEGSLIGIARPDAGFTGFSDMMRPGMISRLVEDRSVAFRVEFESEIPGFDHLYWRGIVFAHFDGKSWHRNRQTSEIALLPGRGEESRYRVTLEPHGGHWLFVLDYPQGSPDADMFYDDLTMSSKQMVRRVKRYRAASGIRDHTGRITSPGHEYTALPYQGNARSRALAAELAKGGADTETVVNRGLDYFRKNDFVYTLRPPRLESDPIDRFLFDIQRGYCEHYASAFVFLMRAAGVPARVVGGYLGGEINPFGNYLIVRQSHAHAWAEVWKEDKGWVRVDPTIAIAPGRISGGLEGALSPDELGWLNRKYLHPVAVFITQVRFGWDMFSKNWEAWFAGYSYDDQKAILERLGIDLSRQAGHLKLMGTGLVLVFMLFGAYLIFHLHRNREKPDKIKKPVSGARL